MTKFSSKFWLTCLTVSLSYSSAVFALGVPNVQQVPGTLLSGPNSPESGRTAVIAYHGGMLITFPEEPGSPGGDHLVRAWDISNPSVPVVTQVLGLTDHGYLAHGFMKSGDRLNSAYTFEVDGAGIVTESAEGWTFPRRGWGHSGMSRPWGITDFWSYGDTSEPAEISLNGDYNNPPDAVFDPVGLTGVIGHAFVFGTYLFYASDQSRTGIASYDVSDPSNPVLLDVLTNGSVGGYWPDPVGINGRLYFFFPRNQPEGGYQVVDATDPTDLQLVADFEVEGNPNYAQFQDEYAFTERYKIDMRTFEIVLELDEEGTTRGGDPIDTSQFALPIGNLVVTGGLYIGGTCSVPGFGSFCGTGMSIWAHQAEPDTRGPFVGYHQPANGATNFPTTHSIQVLVHETLQSETINASTVQLYPIVNDNPGAQVDAEYYFASNDILSIVPTNPLAQNTTYEVSFVADGILDAVGNGMQPYSFRFSTGSDVSGNAPPTISALTINSNPVNPGSPATLTASATDPEGGSVEYRFDFGDGSSTGWQASNNANHVYTNPGHYTALVQVRDAEFAVASRSLGVTVIDPPPGGPGVHNQPLALDSSRQIWAVNPDNNSVSVFNADLEEKLWEVRTCADPRSVAIDGNDRAWITCHDSDQVLILDGNGERQAVVNTGYGSAPFAVVYSAVHDRIIVSLHGSGEVVMINPGDFVESDRLAVGPTPRALALTQSENRLLVTRFISPQEHGEVWDVAVTSANLVLTRTITFAHQWGVDDRAEGRGVPNYLSAVSVAPDGQTAWVTAKKDNVTRGTYNSGISLDQDNTVRATLMQIDLNTNAERFEQRSDLDNSEQPSSVLLSNLGDYAFVTLQGNNAVALLDTLKIAEGFSGASSVVSRIGVGLAPQGLLYDATTQQLWVQNFMDRNLSVLDLEGFFDGSGPTFPQQLLDKTGTEQLASDVLLGKQVFYNASDPRMSGEGYISCASCHIDGGHDGRTFDFTDRGEGLRNTISLRGRAGMGHGLVHWSANFDEIQDFEHDIRGPFGGTGFLTDGQFATANTPLGNPKAGMSTELDGLAAYLTSLDRQTLPRSPLRNPDGSMTAAAVAGQSVFATQGCGSCHAGTDFTSNTSMSLNLQDVGTTSGGSGQRLGGSLDGIDIPTLNGVYHAAPYLHDGSAADLQSVFLYTGGATTQAESGSISGAAEVRDSEHWSLAGQAVVRTGEFVAFEAGASVTLNVDGDGGGPANLRLRYHANYTDANLTVTVNGSSQAVVAPETLNFWRYEQWEQLTIPVNLNAGSNTVQVAYNSGGGFALDELTVSDTAPLMSAASPHLVAATLNNTQLDNLIAYLNQLDGRPTDAMEIAFATPVADQVLAGQVEIFGTAGSSSAFQVQVAVDFGPYQTATGGESWEFVWDTQSVADGMHVLSARIIDQETGTWIETQRQFEVNQITGEGGDLMFASGFEPIQ